MRGRSKPWRTTRLESPLSKPDGAPSRPGRVCRALSLKIEPRRSRYGVIGRWWDTSFKTVGTEVPSRHISRDRGPTLCVKAH